MKIAILSCVSMKLEFPAKAKDIYISPLFTKSYAYAKSLNVDQIYILSAEHHLLDPEKVIEPYNKTLNTMSKQENKEWSNVVLSQLQEKTNLKEDEFIFLAGVNYRQHLLPHITHYSLPMEGLGIGQQLGFLTQKLSNIAPTPAQKSWFK